MYIFYHQFINLQCVINVSQQYIITKTQYLVLFSFSKFLDPVSNIVPKELLTYSLTFIYKVMSSLSKKDPS